MKRTLILALLFLCAASLPSVAELSVSDRRIEEEKRMSLRPTEQVAFEPKEPAKEPSAIDVDYFKELLSRRIACISDASKVLAILMEADGKSEDPESLIVFLKEKKVFPKDIVKDLTPGTPLRKGVAAYMFCAGLDIRKGVILKLFGLSERYAMKELAYEGMLSPGDAYDIMTGKELALLFLGADAYVTDMRRSKTAGEKTR